MYIYVKCHQTNPFYGLPRFIEYPDSKQKNPQPSNRAIVSDI